MQSVAHGAARCCLLGTIAAGPWLIGSVSVRHQLWLAGGVLAAAIAWAVGCLLDLGRFETRRRPLLTATAITAIVGAIVVALQLAPLGEDRPPQTSWQEQIHALPPPPGIPTTPAETSQPVSISPTATRLELARVVLAVCVLIMSADLFSERRHRVWLFGTLAATGAALTVFGMAQRLSWNGKLFWTIPLRFGGQPFASFVNRNNAAGFLILCLGATLGAVMLFGTEPRSPRSRSRIMACCVLLLFVAAGVAASFSRGGVVAATCGLLAVLVPFYRVFGNRLAYGLSVAALGVVALVAWLGFDGQLETRLKTLHNWPSVMDFRLTHWRDMLPAVHNRPWLGSGAGTYRYVNRPYQEHVANGWFWHADNQYLEVLVETGLIGAGILAFVLLSFSRDVWRLGSAGPRNPHSDIAVAALFLLVALGLQSFTDFGVTLLALLFPAAALIGAASGAASARPAADPRGWNPPPRFRSGPAIVATAVALVAVGACLELQSAEATASFSDSLPLDLTDPDALSRFELAAALERGSRLLATSPDDPELLHNLARLMIYQYRREFTRLASEGGSPPAGSSWWTESSLENLHRNVCLAPDPALLDVLREDPLVRRHLGPAYQLLRDAQARCDWVPGLHHRLALLAAVESVSDPRGVRWLRRAAALDAAEPDRLLMTGAWALQAHDDELAILCLRRVLDLEPDWLPGVLTVARFGLDDVDIGERILSTPEELVAFARETTSSAAKSDVRRRLQPFLDEALASGASGRHAYLTAQVARLDAQPSLAVQHLQRAVSEDPLQVQWRVELADLLAERGEYAEAREHLAFAANLAPERADVHRRLAEVVAKQLRESSRQSSK